MSSDPVKNVVIAGGGTAGWMAAVALARQLGSVLNITLVESAAIGTVGVGEASVPPMRVFHKLLRIDEQEFMRETQATFKLGISFESWKHPGEDYIHAFGRHGKETWLGEFHHFWLRARELGFGDNFGDYCYELQAARAGRFATAPASGAISYAYHLDATRYARYLRTLCEKEGVVRREGKITRVIQSDGDGSIQALQLDSGDLVEGDLFLDCTGFRGLLIEEALHTGYEDWSHWLPCDRAWAVQTESTRPPLPYTRSIARSAGWQWQIPLQHRVGNGHVYCSRYLSDEGARAELLNNLDGKPLTEPRLIRYRTGRRHKVWNKNCVALGLSSGFVEPLESTSIHLMMMGVTHLLKMFPFNGINAAIVQRYNSVVVEEQERIRDFIILHYHVSQRQGTAFWRHCRQMEIPDSLAQRIALFCEDAQAYQRDGELFHVDSWAQVMLGQGLEPKAYHPVARVMEDKQLREFLSDYRQSIAQAVAALPLHQDFLKQYCPAREP